MVPMKCDGPCARTLMIWDTVRLQSRDRDREYWLCEQCLVGEGLELPSKAPQIVKRWDPGFTGPEDGSEDRYVLRRSQRPWAIHTFWWFVHNCVSHVMIGLVPMKPFFKFHDWTSRKMHGR